MKEKKETSKNKAVLNGECCASCGIYFNEPHGFPVLCNHCYTEDSNYGRAWKE